MAGLRSTGECETRHVSLCVLDVFFVLFKNFFQTHWPQEIKLHICQKWWGTKLNCTFRSCRHNSAPVWGLVGDMGEMKCGAKLKSGFLFSFGRSTNVWMTWNPAIMRSLPWIYYVSVAPSLAAFHAAGLKEGKQAGHCVAEVCPTLRIIRSGILWNIGERALSAKRNLTWSLYDPLCYYTYIHILWQSQYSHSRTSQQFIYMAIIRQITIKQFTELVSFVVLMLTTNTQISLSLLDPNTSLGVHFFSLQRLNRVKNNPTCKEMVTQIGLNIQHFCWSCEACLIQYNYYILSMLCFLHSRNDVAARINSSPLVQTI